MQSYFKNCKKHPDSTFPEKSKYANCLTERTFIDETEDKFDLESELEVYLQFFTDWCYKIKWRLIVQSVEKNPENLNSKTFKTENDRLIMQSKCTECEIAK